MTDRNIIEKLNNVETYKYYIHMKGNKFTIDDITWLAHKTYGWQCGNVISLDNPQFTDGEELKDKYLIEQIIGTYQIANCSDGTKLRVYPRKDNYPMITNINGGWE